MRERLVEKHELDKKVTTLENKIMILESNLEEAKKLNIANTTTTTSPQVEIEQTTITIIEDTMQKEFEQQMPPAIPLKPEPTIKIEELEALPATPVAVKTISVVREPEITISEQKMDIVATPSTPSAPSTPTDPTKISSGQVSTDGQKKIRKIKRPGLTSNEPDPKRHQTAPPSHNVLAAKVQFVEPDTSTVQSTQTTTYMPLPVITTPTQSIITTTVSDEIKNTQTTDTETQQTSQKDIDEPDAEGGSTDDNEDEML